MPADAGAGKITTVQQSLHDTRLPETDHLLNARTPARPSSSGAASARSAKGAGSSGLPLPTNVDL